MNYPIGEFSRMTRVTLKALRLYHDKGILVPDFVDPESGYRYYSQDQIRDARVIRSLKEMGFSLQEISEVLDECEDDGDLVERLNEKKSQLELRVSAFRKSIREIEDILVFEEQLRAKDGFPHEIEEKWVPDLLIAGHRMKGRYEEVGRGFKVLGRHAGRVAAGKAMCLYYDGEYKEEGADFEPCFEVKREVSFDGIDCRSLPGGRALTVMHVGPYERLGESYARLFELMKREKVEALAPSREIFHKGPGMILRGNPEKYVTEIQMLVAD